MTAKIIDGKTIAAELRARVAGEGRPRQARAQLAAGLAVVLVGNDPRERGSMSASKHKQTQEAGMASFEHKLPENVAQDDLLAVIAKLNRDPDVHGILVQLPLPKHLHTETIINAIDPPRMSTGCIRTMPAGSPAAFSAVALHAARAASS